MALSHLPLLHPCKSSLNCDVDQQLILFPFLEPVAGTAEELATEIPPQDAVDTKLAVCTSVCKIKSLSMSFRDCECMMLTVLGCLCLSICFPNWPTKPECGFKLNGGCFSVCVRSMLPTSSVCVASPLWSVLFNTPTILCYLSFGLHHEWHKCTRVCVCVCIVLSWGTGRLVMVSGLVKTGFFEKFDLIIPRSCNVAT